MPPLSDAQLQRVCELLHARTGIVVGADRLDALRGALNELMSGEDRDDFDRYFVGLHASRPNQPPLQSLVERMVIGETFFFRDDGQFSALRHHVLPDIIAYRAGEDRRINVVSAGCATGEEPYSIAMLLHELLPDREDWKINIIGVDISQPALVRARDGLYGEWSFRGVARSVIDRYFVAHEHDVRFAGRPGGYELVPEIRNMVTFAYLNLVEGLPFLDVDLILWRNVGIYFNQETRRQLASRCFQALRDGGWLFVGATELSSEYFRANETVHIGEAIVYKKSVERAPGKANSRHGPRRLGAAKEVARAGQPSPDPEHRSPPPTPTSLAAAGRARLARTERGTVEEAEDLVEQGEVDRALALLEGPLANDPTALYLRARIHADRGQHNEAADACTRYIEKLPHVPDGYYLQGLIFQAEHKDTLAAEAFRKALFLERDFIMGHFTLGALYLRIERKDAGVRHLNHARRLLAELPPHQIVSHSEGQTAQRLLKSTDQVLRRIAEP